MKKIVLIVCLVLIQVVGWSCYGQDLGLKSADSLEVWTVPKSKSAEIQASILKYPILVKENEALINLGKSKERYFEFQKDSLIAINKRQIKKVKKAKLFGNLKTGLVAGIGAILILK